MGQGNHGAGGVLYPGSDRVIGHTPLEMGRGQSPLAGILDPRLDHDHFIIQIQGELGGIVTDIAAANQQ